MPLSSLCIIIASIDSISTNIMFCFTKTGSSNVEDPVFYISTVFCTLIVQIIPSMFIIHFWFDWIFVDLFPIICCEDIYFELHYFFCIVICSYYFENHPKLDVIFFKSYKSKCYRFVESPKNDLSYYLE